MKIIQILNGKANPDSQNGVNNVVHSLATSLLDNSVEVEVWGITKTPQNISHKCGYSLRLFKQTAARFQLSPELRLALSKLDKSCIVHFHSGFIPEYFSISKALKKQGIRWVISPHSAYIANLLPIKKALKSFYFKYIEWHFLKNAYAVVATGESEKYGVIQRLQKGKLVMIPNGLSQSGIESQTPANPKKNNHILFGCYGRLDIRQKGLDILLAGFKEYILAGGEGELWFIGGGRDLGKLKMICSDKVIRDKVKFLGPLFGTAKLNAQRKVDVAVHPSRWEGFPLCILEMASLSIPLIVSRHTNFSKYVDQWNSGQSLHENSSSCLAKAMAQSQESFNSNKLGEIGENALRMVNAEFVWSKIASRHLLEVYGNLK